MNFIIFTTFFVILNFEYIYGLNCTANRTLSEPGKFITFSDTVEPFGYPTEAHSVVTDDGYILTLHRIPGSPQGSCEAQNKPVVIFFVGISCSSEIFTMIGPEQGLPFLLADKGFDVWFLNHRGNYYSRRHVSLSPNKDKKLFWQFSFHENGIYDVPTAIDYILRTTGQSRLSIIGHSMGTTMGFIALSIRPEYNEKINLFVAMAPNAIFTHQIPGLYYRPAIEFLPMLEIAAKFLDIHEAFPRSNLYWEAYKYLCIIPHLQPICQKYFMSGIKRMKKFNVLPNEIFQRAAHHFPEGTSIQTLLHYGQLFRTGKFREFDYGNIMNLKKYQSITPPSYPLEKITAPVMIYWGNNDGYSWKKDTEVLLDILPNAVGKMVPNELFDHVDFTLYKNVKEVLYDDVINQLEKSKNG